MHYVSTFLLVEYNQARELISATRALTLGLGANHEDGALEAQEEGSGCVGQIEGDWGFLGEQGLSDRPHHSFRFVPNYLLPSFSNTRGPCSSHSCLEIHISSLSAIYLLH